MAIRVIPDDTVLQNTALAIQSKDHGGKMTVDEMSSRVNALNVKLEEKDANFFDYDGELLYTYTKQEALALTELPPLPTGRQYLTAQSWGRTLADIKTYLQEGQTVDTGVIYAVTDNKTKFFVNIQPDINDDSIDFTISIKNGTVTIYVDGDVFSTENETSGSYVNHTVTLNSSTLNNYYGEHLIELEYSGDYDYQIGEGFFSDRSILTTALLDNKCTVNGSAFRLCVSLESISVSTYSFSMSGYNAFNYCSSLKCLTISQANRIDNMCQYCASLKYVNFPKTTVNIKCDGAVQYCSMLKNVIIPETTKNIAAALTDNTNLEKIILSKNVTNFGTYFCERCYNLKYATIIKDDQYTFRGCISLQKIKIYNTVTTVGKGAYGAYAKVVDMTDFTDPTNIPPLQSSTTFPVVNIILFSSQTVADAFANETNWSIYADKFQVDSGGVS